MGFEVHVFGDSLLKYFPSQEIKGDFSVCFRRFVHRGATIKKLMEEEIKPAITKGIPHSYQAQGRISHIIYCVLFKCTHLRWLDPAYFVKIYICIFCLSII